MICRPARMSSPPRLHVDERLAQLARRIAVLERPTQSGPPLSEKRDVARHAARRLQPQHPGDQRPLGIQIPRGAPGADAHRAADTQALEDSRRRRVSGLCRWLADRVRRLDILGSCRRHDRHREPYGPPRAHHPPHQLPSMYLVVNVSSGIAMPGVTFVMLMTVR